MENRNYANLMESIQHRNEAFVSIVDRLSKKRKRIYRYIEQNPGITAQGIAAGFMVPINEVTGRITELKSACMVVESGASINRYTKHKNTAYRAVGNESERIQIINEHLIDLIEKRNALKFDSKIVRNDFTNKVIAVKIKSLNKKINTLLKCQQ